MNRLIRKLGGVSVLAVGVIAALVASGCGAAAGKSSNSCEQMVQPRQGETAVAVIAVDGVAGLGLDGEGALRTAIAAATAEEARMLLASAGDGKSAPLTVDTRLAREGENDLMRDKALECRTQLVRDGYEKIASRAPGEKLDLISSLRGLAAGLPAQQGGTMNLVVLGSATNTAEVDLRERAVRQSPARSINALARAGLNFRCDGWRVHMVGGGLTEAGSVPGTVDSELREWWRRYFAHCGGALVFYAPELTEFPAAAEEVAASDRSLIPIKIERREDRIEATLSGDVLFAFESAALRPAAAAVLRRLLPDLAASAGTIEVTGYTDSIGSAAVNEPLSRERAVAVARWIEAEARIPGERIETQGRGEAEPVASNAGATGRAKNRRVVVVIPGA
jgi:outer membrane protein OmpA-like peptidoglycan-associated protein